MRSKLVVLEHLRFPKGDDQIAECAKNFFAGEVAEWFKALVCYVNVCQQHTKGSNPFLSVVAGQILGMGGAQLGHPLSEGTSSSRGRPPSVDDKRQ